MPNYAFTYYGEPSFRSSDDAARYKEKYMEWLKGLGDAWINPGTPLGKPKVVSSSGVSDGGGSNRLTGFSVMKARSIDAAVEIAKGCPHLQHGIVNVAEVMEMKM